MTVLTDRLRQLFGDKPIEQADETVHEGELLPPEAGHPAGLPMISPRGQLAEAGRRLARQGVIAADDAPATREAFAAAIGEEWRAATDSIIRAGRLLAEAKERLDHGEFTPMVEVDLKMSPRTAQRLMAIGADARLANPTHVSLLPPSWGTLYVLTRLDDATLAARFADGTIRPDMQRRDIAQVAKRARRAEREAELAGRITALPEDKFGVILADPEWRFEPWSAATGMDRAAENHYPTSVTEVIASRPLADIAAADCALFQWATVPMLPQAQAVMAAWGFDYKSHWIWVKTRPDGSLALGTGYWNRNAHEILLVGTRGNVPAPAMGDQSPSVIYAPPGRHSEKPDIFLEMIEGMFPTIPKIELNRRGPARPGWAAWGNEAGEAPAEDDQDNETAATAIDAAAGASGPHDPEAGAPAATTADEPPPEDHPPPARDPDLDIPPFLRRGHPDCLADRPPNEET